MRKTRERGEVEGEKETKRRVRVGAVGGFGQAVALQHLKA